MTKQAKLQPYYKVYQAEHKQAEPKWLGNMTTKELGDVAYNIKKENK